MITFSVRDVYVEVSLGVSLVPLFLPLTASDGLVPTAHNMQHSSGQDPCQV